MLALESLNCGAVTGQHRPVRDGQIQNALLRNRKRFACNHSSGEILFDAFGNRVGLSVLPAAQFVTEQALGNVLFGDSPRGKQRGRMADFRYLVQGRVFLLRRRHIVQHGMRDFMDGGADSLRLAHPLPERDVLVFGAEKSVQIRGERLKIHRNRRHAAQGFHKRLIMLNVSRKGSDDFRQGLSLRLRYVEHLHRPEQRNLNGLYLHNGFPVRVRHRQLGVRVQLFLLNLLFERRGRDNRNALFAFFHMTPEPLLPLPESRAFGGVGLLQVD